MAHVRSAILCDFAQVREGLLFIASGGITRVASPGLDAPVRFYVAGEIEVPIDESDQSIEVRFNVTAAETSLTVWEAKLSVMPHKNQTALFPGENHNIAFSLPVGPFPTRAFGPHDLKVSIGNSETELLTFYVLQIVQS